MNNVKRSMSAGVAVALALTLSACADFFGNDSLKELIKADVDEAVAAEVDLLVRADPVTTGGTTSLAATTKKMGVAFPISVTTFPEYAFAGWTELDGNAAVLFEDATAATTAATVTKDVTGIIIQANFTRRPEVDTTDPWDGDTVFKNKKIMIYFSKAMDPASVDFSTISIVSKPYGSTSLPTPIESKFDAPVAATGNILFTISLKTGQTLDENHVVTVKVSRLVRDADQNEMAADKKFSFLVSTSSDTDPPYWDSPAFTITRADGTALGAGLSTNSPDLLLKARALDADDMVLYLNVTETGGGDTQSTPDILYQSSIPYTLRTAGTGSKTISVVAEDPTGNPSSAQAITIIYDTDRPGIPTLASAVPNCEIGGIHYYGNSVSGVTFTLAATDTGGSDLRGFTTDPAGLSPVPVPTPTLGIGTHRLYAVDNAGNVSSGYLELVVGRDTVVPQIDASALYDTTVPATANKTDGGATVRFTASDASTGIASYSITGAGVLGSPVTGTASDGVETTRAITVTASGTVTLTVSDAVGNEKTTSFTVTLDDAPPAISSDSLKDKAKSISLRTSGIATLAFTPTDTQSGISRYTVAGAGITAVDQTGTWTSGTALTQDITVTASCTVTLTVYDGVGRSFSKDYALVFDNQGPDVSGLTATAAAGSYFSGSVASRILYYKTAGTYRLNALGGATDPSGTVEYRDTSGGVPVTYIDVSASRSFFAADPLGNVTEISIAFTPDGGNPAIAGFGITDKEATGVANRTDGVATLTFTPSDALTGISRYTVTGPGVTGVDVSTGLSSGTQVVKDLTITATGLVTLTVYDGVGNTETSSVTVTRDVGGPDVTNLTATAETGSYFGGSGTSRILYYRVSDTYTLSAFAGADDDSDPVEYRSVSGGPAVASINVNSACSLYVADALGNQTTVNIAFTLDPAAPVISAGSTLVDKATGISLITDGTMTLSFTATDTLTNISRYMVTGPGVDDVDDAEGWASGAVISKDITISASGTVTLTVYDGVGRMDTETYAVIYDDAPPDVDALEATAETGSYFGGSGPSRILYYASAGTYTLSDFAGATDASGTVVYSDSPAGTAITSIDLDAAGTLYVRDAFGHERTVAIAFTLDATAPAISLPGTTTGSYGTSVPITSSETASATESGLASATAFHSTTGNSGWTAATYSGTSITASATSNGVVDYFKVVAVDRVGNTATKYFSRTHNSAASTDYTLADYASGSGRAVYPSWNAPTRTPAVETVSGAAVSTPSAPAFAPAPAASAVIASSPLGQAALDALSGLEGRRSAAIDTGGPGVAKSPSLAMERPLTQDGPEASASSPKEPSVAIGGSPKPAADEVVDEVVDGAIAGVESPRIAVKAAWAPGGAATAPSGGTGPSSGAPSNPAPEAPRPVQLAILPASPKAGWRDDAEEP